MANVYIKPDYFGTQVEAYTCYFTWTERLQDPTVFTAANISVTNGTLSNFALFTRTHDLTTYQATITPPTTGSGNTTITVAANVYDSNDATTQQIPYAQSATNRIKIYTAPSGVRSGPFWVYIVLYPSPKNSRDIFGVSNFGIIAYLGTFTEDDVTVTNGTKTNYTGVIVPQGSSFGDASVKFLCTPDTGVTSVTITVRANAIGDSPLTTLNVPISATPVNVTKSDAAIPSTAIFPVITRYQYQSFSTTIGPPPRLYGVGTTISQGIDFVNLQTGEITNNGLGVPGSPGNQVVHAILYYGGNLFLLINSGNRTNVKFYNQVGPGGSANPIGSTTNRAFPPEANTHLNYTGLVRVGNEFHTMWRDVAGVVGAAGRNYIVVFDANGGYSRRIYSGFSNVDPQTLTYYNNRYYFISAPITGAPLNESAGLGYGLYSMTTANGGSLRREGDFGSSVSTALSDNYWLSNRNLYTVNYTNRQTTPYNATQFISSREIVNSLTFTNDYRYLVVNKRSPASAVLIQFDDTYTYQDHDIIVDTIIHDTCEINNDLYLLYEQNSVVYLGLWSEISSSIMRLVTVGSSNRFMICYNNLLFVSDASVTTFRAYGLTGNRLTEDDFSLVHSQPRGTIKSVSSSDRGFYITHRLDNNTFIYRYNNSGIYGDSISVLTDPTNLLTKSTTIVQGVFYVANENPVVDAMGSKLVINAVSIGTVEGSQGIEYLGPTKIVVNNFEPIDLKPLFFGELTIQEGIGILLDYDFTFVDGVLTLQYITGRDPVFDVDELFFPFVAINNQTFLEQEIYFSLKQNLNIPIWNQATQIIAEQPDQIDLHEFVLNADTINFESGFTIPTGVGITNNTLSVARDTVSSDSEFILELTATNAIGSVNKNINLIILNTHSNLKVASYWQTDIIEKVYINDIDISEYIQSVEGIDLSLDSQFLNVQKVSDASIKVNDPDGFFSAPSYDNFFVKNGLNRTGFNVPLKVEYGYKTSNGDSTRVLFFGHILRVSQDTNGASATIVAIDYSEQILASNLHNFGLQKKLIYTQAGLIGRSHGEYRLNDIFFPISDQSLSGRARNFAFFTSQNEDALATEGTQNWSNIKIEGDKIQSEGALVPYTPIFLFRSQLRNFSITDILRELLISQGIYNYRFDLSQFAGRTSAHFQNLGSPVYKYEPSQSLSVRDWFAFGGDSYYLLGSNSISESDKFIKKQSNKVITNLFVANSDDSLWKVAIEPFRNILWMWSSEKFNTDTIPLGTYDSSEASNKTKMLRYDMNTDTLTTQIPSDHTNALQIATRYLLGRREEPLSLRKYALPNNRRYAENWYDAAIGDWLFYKFANSTSFGVANFDLVNETVTQTMNQTNDIYGNQSCFDIALNGDALFFAYTVGTANSATLYIKQYNPRTSTETTFYQATTTYADTDFYDEVSDATGAIYNGVFECFATTTHVYVNVQLQKESTVTAGARSFNRNAGAILYSIPRTGTTNPTANDGLHYMMKLYEWCQISPHSFYLDNNRVYFFEGSPYLYQYKPILATGDEAVWKDLTGFVQYIENNQLTRLGLAWRDLSGGDDSIYDGIYGSIDGPIRRVHRGHLHFFIGKEGSAVPDNNQIINDYEEILYAPDILPVIPALETNNKSVYDILNSINQLTYTFTSFENNKLIIQSKRLKSAEFVSITGTTLTFKNLSDNIPLVGFIKLEQEYIAYDGNSATTLLNIKRNQLGTVSRFYQEGDLIIFFDHIIDATTIDNPILSISMQNDYNFLANVTTVQYGQSRTNYLEDSVSINLNGRKEISIPTDMDDHQKAWAETLNRLYLDELKDLKQSIELTLKPSFYLRLGQVIILRFPQRAKIDTLCRITRIQFNKTNTQISLKTLRTEIITKVSSGFVQRIQGGAAFDNFTDRLYFNTRYRARLAWIQTAPNSEITGLPVVYGSRGTAGTQIEGNCSISGRNIYIKDTVVYDPNTTPFLRIAIGNLDTLSFGLQYYSSTNRPVTNYAMVVDDEQNIYVGEELAGVNILRQMTPHANPSPTNLMTPGNYIQLQPRLFNQSRGHIVNVIGSRALTWHNGSIYGIDADNNLIVRMVLSPITGSNNRLASITEDVVVIPPDVEQIVDIARGSNCWYVIGSDGTRAVVDGPTSQPILWIWTILD